MTAPEHIEEHGDDCSQREDEIHAPVAERAYQYARDAAATAETYIVCAQEGGVRAAPAFRRRDVHGHRLQRRFYAAEGVTGEDCGKIETEIARGKGQQQEGSQHGRVA